MSMTPTEAYEKMVIRAVLTNDTDKWVEAHTLSCVYGFSKRQIEACHASVERWLRLHGVTKISEGEITAIVLIQSAVRRWLVLRLLQRQYDMYFRLAQLDSPDHCRRALAIQRTLACAWGQIKC